MKLLTILCFCLFATQTYAIEEVDYISEVDDAVYKQLNPRLYRGEGEHQCQSSQSIGHTCKNLGVNFTDCNHAFFRLKMEDCCKGSDGGGRSISFKLTKCTNFN
jgi:hypothetical protein